MTVLATNQTFAPIATIPILEQGDCLSRVEFERRYGAMRGVKKAELIEGVVHMPSPVRFNHHADPHADLMTWLGVYRANSPGIRIADNVSVRLDLENEPQPDAVMFIDPACGGNVTISDDDYVVGAPELVAEVAASSVSIDLNAKLRVYRRNQVREYLVWRVQDQAFDWFVLRQEQYERLAPNAAGTLESPTFPGLWLDPAALLRADLAVVLRTLQRGIDTPAHLEFVGRLQAKISS